MSDSEADVSVIEIKIQNLKKSRGGYKGRVTYFKNKLAKNELTSIGELQSTLHRIRITYDKFDEVQSRLENVDPTETESTDRYDFEEEYGHLESAILDKIDTLEINKKIEFSESNLKLKFDQVNLVKDNVIETSVAIKLPQITLPKFDGTELAWLSFRDIFCDLIHSNKSISAITKFHYLISSLRVGKAFHLIEGLPITSDNYELAWTTIFNHYNNEISIQKLHLKNLYDVKKPIENSSSSLQYFVESIEKHYNALKSLNVQVQGWNLILIHHLMEKLDSLSRIEVAKNSPSDKLLEFPEFINILKKRVKILEVITQNKATPLVVNKNMTYKNNRVFVSNQVNCPLCKDNHILSSCPKFYNSDCTPLQRYEIVRNLKLCTNCLASAHRVFECKASHCKRCSLKHHTLLHFEKMNLTSKNQSSSTSFRNCDNTIDTPIKKSMNSHDIPTTSSASSIQVDSKTDSCQSIEKNVTLTQVMLATAVVWVESSTGNRTQCRVLLDSGSQSNYITENLCQLLNPIKSSVYMKVSGINGKVTEVKFKVNLKIQSRVSKYNSNLEFLVLPKITGEIPSCSLPFDSSKIPKNVMLADPKFFVNNKIDMLIGAEKYNEIVSSVTIKIVPELPPFQKTKLGYIVLGKTNYSSGVESSMNISTSFLSTNDELNRNINKFWELEQIHTPNNFSIEEKMCEGHYVQNTVRLPNGRYSVALPVKSNVSDLGDNKSNALKQFQYLESKLAKEPNMHKQYKEFIKEYIELQHMQLITNSDLTDCQYGQTYMLPHHAVLKESSTTTKLRVVFNASSKTNSNISLNDCLMTGPTIQQDLFSIIIRFRKYLVALSADITKMYRQIRINNNDQDLMRIYWRDSPNDQLQCYRLCTVTYGTSSAPFQAIRTLKQLSIDERNNFPRASKILERDFYVDDVLTGANSIQEAQQLKLELQELLARGGFELRKWNSNCNILADDTSQSDVTSENIILLLGLKWNSSSDGFQINLREMVIRDNFTKRSILSEIAQLFDPLGLCAPVIVTAKLVMQSLWTTPNLLWDDEVPLSISQTWSKFRQQLASIRELDIPRCIMVNNTKSIELHGFGDASEKAYGCVVYIVVTDTSNIKHISLLCAKSRIAPLKRQSIPRLELCAAVLLAQLVNKITQVMEINFKRICLWSDSEITILRIKSCPSTFTTFVANRISIIQDLSSIENWMYVPTAVNPADLISRGMMPDDIVSSRLWWKGPSFLESDANAWPKSSNNKINPELLELKKVKVGLLVSKVEFDILERYSDINKLLRIVAMCCRFCYNLKTEKALRKYGELTSVEIDSARKRILKHVQYNEYNEDILYLRKHKSVQSTSKLKSFSPFLDEDGLLRVGGRLENATISFDNKHQIILPSSNTFTKMLVRNEHYRQLHAGPQALLYSLRLQYWILGGRNLCRKVVHECIRCFRTRPTSITQLMGQLPTPRVTPARAFLNVGIDFCGPFNLTHKLRKKVLTKAYVAIFICFCAKAIHMEIVEDLSTQAFLASFRRFVARRGKCANVYSDNATNFVGAKTELKDLHELFSSEIKNNKVLQYFAEEQIQLHTIPPKSPHFGGLWEAAVKSAKYHLKRVVGNMSCKFEEFHTLITQIEACLNSRPLTPMSSDPFDLQVLTPGHFIIGSALTSVPDPSLVHLDVNRLSRWQRIQFMFQQFWKRWQFEYLSELQQRRKWVLPSKNVSVGSLVLLKEDNIPPLKWLIGRISEIHPGNDGHIRVVTVKTANSEFKRAIAKVCVLPMEVSSSGKVMD